MAKKPERTIPTTTDAESLVADATDLERQIVQAEGELEERKLACKLQREVVDGLYQELRGLFADEDRPLLAAAEESD